MPELYKPVTSSLRTRLLLITVLFVALVEVCVYLPAIATFRQNFLDERLRAGELATLTLEQASGRRVSPQFEVDLLDGAGLFSVVVKRPDFTLILGGDTAPDTADASFDLRNTALGPLVMDALATLDAEGDRIIRVTGNGHTRGTSFVEVTLLEKALYEALNDYSNNILLISIVISLFTGILIYLALHWLVVRPMRRIKENIVSFSQAPERANSKLGRSRRTDEIGVVERELARMQEELRMALQQKTRLADLGEAVSKINHDLRNILATAQLASDSLSRSDDPKVQRTAARLLSAVSRAVALCERTMRHGKAAEPAPEPRPVKLLPIVREVGDSLGLMDMADFQFVADFDKAFTIYADEDQLHRVLMNLCRNAFEAQGESGSITITAMHGKDGLSHIRIRDKGPGIPDKALPNLFKAFSTSNKAGGTGLGLAVARDIVLAHGGQIGLESSGPDGSTFLVCLPDEGAVMTRDSKADTRPVSDADAPSADSTAEASAASKTDEASSQGAQS